MMNARYTESELVTRLWDKEQIKDLLCRRCYYKQNDWRARELAELWVQAPEHQKTMSLSNNLGYFVGPEAITEYYVTQLQDLRARQQTYLPGSAPGQGVMNAHTYHTIIVELSGDGQTARYLCYDHGTQAAPGPDGQAKGYWTSGHLLADCVKEDGVWRLWHVKSNHDWTMPAEAVPGAGGGMFGGPPPEEGEGSDGPPPEAQGEGPGGPPPMPDLGPDPYEDDYGTPTTALPYEPKWGWNDLPKQMPNTYAPNESYDPKRGYGPEGHPDPLRSWR